MFSDVLLTVDFDRTLTDTESVIPQRNLDAIDYFMENGGTFTINTGRDIATLCQYMHQIKTNAPLLLLNGSASYFEGKGDDFIPIPMDLWETMEKIQEMFPGQNIEIQDLEMHYLIDPVKEYCQLYENNGWRYEIAQKGANIPFLKFAIFGKVHRPVMAHMFEGSEEELADFDRMHKALEEYFGDKIVAFRSAPRIIDFHAPGVSKLNAARNLQKKLGKKILVCVGDAENDLCMLEGADYAFCPSDGIVAERFPNVCTCGEGAVADVIYKEIPKILGILP